MSVWNVASPAGSDPIAQGDDRIREMKQAVQDALNADGGIFPGPAPATDPVYYPVFLKDAEANRPAPSTDYPGRLFFDEDLGTLQRLSNDGLTWVDLFKNPATQAVHAAAAAALASVGGVVTLPETANAFQVTGTEEVTSIAGWDAGLVVMQWASPRNIKNSTTLQLRNGQDRKVVANDISVFFFADTDTVSEIGFYGAGMGKEVGEIMDYPAETLPPGFLECDGSSQLRTDYPALFLVLGTAHGSADSSHFNLPDRRGLFVRGWDHGAGKDPDAATRAAAALNGTTGDHVGTDQADDFISHTHLAPHTTPGSGGPNFTGPVYSGSGSGGGWSEPINLATAAAGDAETRPKNRTTQYVIKY